MKIKEIKKVSMKIPRIYNYESLKGPVLMIKTIEYHIIFFINFKSIIWKQNCSETQQVCLKVSKFQNEFLKSSFLPNYERKIIRISAKIQIPPKKKVAWSASSLCTCSITRFFDFPTATFLSKIATCGTLTFEPSKKTKSNNALCVQA